MLNLYYKDYGMKEIITWCKAINPPSKVRVMVTITG